MIPYQSVRLPGTGFSHCVSTFLLLFCFSNKTWPNKEPGLVVFKCWMLCLMFCGCSSAWTSFGTEPEYVEVFCLQSFVSFAHVLFLLIWCLQVSHKILPARAHSLLMWSSYSERACIWNSSWGNEVNTESVSGRARAFDCMMQASSANYIWPVVIQM